MPHYHKHTNHGLLGMWLKLSCWLIGVFLLSVSCSSPIGTRKNLHYLKQNELEQKLIGIWSGRSKKFAHYLHLTPRNNTPYMDALWTTVSAFRHLAPYIMATAHPFTLDNNDFLKFQQILVFDMSYSHTHPLVDLGIGTANVGPSVIEIPGYLVLQVTGSDKDSLNLRFMNPVILKELMEKKRIKTLLNPNIFETFGLLDISQEELLTLIRGAPIEKLFVEEQANTFLSEYFGSSFKRISAEPLDTGHSKLGVYRLIALTDVANVQIEGADLDDAIKTTRLAVKTAAYFSRTGFPLNSVAENQAKTGDITGAIETAARLTPGSWERHAAFAHIAIAQAENGDIANAIKTVKRNIDGSNRIRPFILIAVVQTRLGDDVGAKQTLRLAVDAALAIESHWDSVRAMKSIAEQQAGMGDNVKALETASLAEQHVLIKAKNCPLALVDVASLQADLGDATAAIESVELVLTCSDDDKKPNLKVRILARSTPVLIKAGHRAEGMTTARKAIELALSSPVSYNNEINRMLSELAELKSVAEDYTLANEVAALALDYAQRLKSDWDRGAPLTISALAQAKAGDIAEALTTLKGLNWWIGPWREILGKIAAIQIKAGDKDSAEATVRLAIDSANLNDLRRLAEAMVEYGYYEGAKKVLMSAVDLVRMEKSSYSRALDFCDITEIQIKAGDKSGARKTAMLAFEAAKNVTLFE